MNLKINERAGILGGAQLVAAAVDIVVLVHQPAIVSAHITQECPLRFK